MANKKRKTTDRADVGEEESVHKFNKADKTRLATGARLRMDISHYLALSIYKDKVLFWATSRNGDVEKWIQLGALPVPKVGAASKIFKGINDRVTDEYEIAHGVSVIDGVSEDNYLMFLPEEEYEELRVAPHKQRNTEISKAMGIGKVEDEAVTMPGVTGMKTYAGHVGGGERGLTTIQGPELQHDV